MIWRGSFLNGVHVRFLIELTLCLAPLTRDNRDRLIVRQPVWARKIGSCGPRLLSPGPKLIRPSALDMYEGRQRDMVNCQHRVGENRKTQIEVDP